MDTYFTGEYMFNKLELNGVWTLTGYTWTGELEKIPDEKDPDIGPIEAAVPGEVHPALHASGLIPDPYYGTNADEVQWVEEKVWRYKKTFRVPDGFVKNKTILKFNGLDTYAVIYLNGHEIGRTSNMFIPHEFDVSEQIIDNVDNTVEVVFAPTVKVLDGIDCSPYFGCFNQSRVNARKQQCAFGWDWTHRLVGAGIWRDVTLTSYDKLIITDFHVLSLLEGHDADAWMYITVDNFSDEEVDAQLVVIAQHAGAEERTEYHETVPPGRSVIEAVIRIDEPELWYPNGMGEQPLYTAMVGISVDGEIQDVAERKFGIRSVDLIEESDSGKKQFTININGKPVYIKGANWIPADHFPSRVNSDTYIRLLKMAQDANFNMLRVWGGGIYEDPEFYSLCDELGIMVWQDFMFSCATYPDHPEFCDDVETEVREVVRGLRNHPSIVLWCGNNECEMNSGEEAEWPGKKLFHETIPAILAEMDETRPYRPSSPFGGSPNNSPDEGDWHGGSWFNVAFGDVSRWKEIIEEEKALFVSEFPTQGAPLIQSVRSFIPEDQMFPPTMPAWEYHNKDNPHSGRTDGTTHQMILANFTGQMMGDYGSAEDFVKKAGVLQGEFLAAEIERYRRDKWHNSGCMFWMYNDCWPAVSWSVVDYYLRPKIAYYYVKRAYNPVILSFAPGEDGVSAWVTNDTFLPVHGSLELVLVTFGEGKKKIDEIPINVPANASQMVWKQSTGLFDGVSPDKQCLAGLLVLNKTVTAQSTWFFDTFRNIRFPDAELRVRRQNIGEGRYRMMIYSEEYARTVAITNVPERVRVSDNYFDLIPGQEKEILIEGVSTMDASVISVELWK
jgi:beta-mannosidase